MWRILSGLWLGWGLGANDASNIFGPGVAAKILSYRAAVILIAIFVTLGAVLEGPKCMETLGKLADIKNGNESFVILFATAFCVMVMSVFGLPISTSQAVVGAILGSVCFKHLHGVEAIGSQFSDLAKIMVCWIGTPIGAMIVAFALYHILDRLLARHVKSIVVLNFFIKWSVIISGCYGAYCLGANNVANVTGIYVSSGAGGLLTAQEAALYGGLAIAVGALTFSYKVMYTVGEKITVIGPLGALIAGVSHSLTVHFYTQIGVPVSSSQAIVGAVVGIGLIKGMKAIHPKTLVQIMIGWISTPIVAGVACYAMIRVLALVGMPVF